VGNALFERVCPQIHCSPSGSCRLWRVFLARVTSLLYSLDVIKQLFTCVSGHIIYSFIQTETAPNCKICMRLVLDIENDGDAEAGADGEKKKRQTRGGRGVVKVKQKQDVEKRICLSRACRGKRKFVTVITGLATYGEIHYVCCEVWEIASCLHKILRSMSRSFHKLSS